jgi:hypothetical protein
MAAYSGSTSVNPYWYYDPHSYQPNVNVSFNTNISGLLSNQMKYIFIFFLLVNTPPHPSFDMYNNNNNSRFADSGYLSRTPTPPTPVRIHSPQPISNRQELESNGSDSNEMIVLHDSL